jgi:hypothetical protein
MCAPPLARAKLALTHGWHRTEQQATNWMLHSHRDEPMIAAMNHPGRLAQGQGLRSRQIFLSRQTDCSTWNPCESTTRHVSCLPSPFGNESMLDRKRTFLGANDTKGKRLVSAQQAFAGEQPLFTLNISVTVNASPSSSTTSHQYSIRSCSCGDSAHHPVGISWASQQMFSILGRVASTICGSSVGIGSKVGDGARVGSVAGDVTDFVGSFWDLSPHPDIRQQINSIVGILSLGLRMTGDPSVDSPFIALVFRLA